MVVILIGYLIIIEFICLGLQIIFRIIEFWGYFINIGIIHLQKLSF